MPDIAWSFLRRSATQVVRRNLDLDVEGLEHVPDTGPVILAARHVHHLYDGCALLATIPRPLHIVVALDWVANRPGRLTMDRLCAGARWPVVLRQEGPKATSTAGAARAWRTAIRDALGLLAEGRVVLVFPEGYPNIDPGYTPKLGDNAFLPFQPGVARLASMASTDRDPVPVIPVGFHYQRGPRWKVTMRFGSPVTIPDRSCEQPKLAELQSRVEALSSVPVPG
jgi:putative membrane protein